MTTNTFAGFDVPQENWSKLPHQLVDVLHLFSSLAELKIVLYILRHTWGFQDDSKRITLDEFEHGRKCADGTRMDKGIGMTKPSIINGIKRAVKHGFVFIDSDVSGNSYSLTYQGLKSLTPPVKKFNPSGKKVLPPDDPKATPVDDSAPPKETKKETKKDSARETRTAHDKKSDKKEGDTTEKPEIVKDKPVKKRDILFDGIAARGFKIPTFNLSDEQLSDLKKSSSRIGDVKKRLLGINPTFKQMSDSDIRKEINDFWGWLKTKFQKEYSFQLSELRDANKWADYYAEFYYTKSSSNENIAPEPKTNPTYLKMIAEQKRLEQLQGENYDSTMESQ